ncbi:helix-turn-helix domain-containing protein [Clostridium tertium]|uniref:helix-turn-helix domain-containing protein n=1 Tax=Clostridium tertium TaxID=1559 RepID=UPI00291BF557|nr:helix-turn-helix transcriptional regulator [Clostridium sp.]
MKVENLKQIRKKSKFNQKELGEKLRISQSSYNKKENGINPFTIDEIKELRTIFSLSNKDIIEIFFEN